MISKDRKIEKKIRYEELRLPKSKKKGREGSTIETLLNLNPDIDEASLSSNFYENNNRRVEKYQVFKRPVDLKVNKIQKNRFFVSPDKKVVLKNVSPENNKN